jgi:hypothetical protein
MTVVSTASSTYNMGSGVCFGGEDFVEVLAATQVRL